MKPKKPNIMQRLKESETEPRIEATDVANLCVALRRGGLLAMQGQDLVNVSHSLARCEAVCSQLIKPPEQSARQQSPPAKPAEKTDG